jgi:D-3-phosphoglycerate dehydrogenase
MYEWVSIVKEGNWEKRNHYQGDELAGKTLGILGMGNIGSRVARLGEAFGMKVIYWSRSTTYSSYTALAIEEVLQQSDIISLHLPLTPETENLLGEKQFALMRPEAILINTARGNLINQQALFKALEQGTIAGFGADVLETEPPLKKEPLIKHPRAIITPHIGSLTTTTYRNMCISTVKNVLAVLDGRKPSPESIFNRKALGIEI